MHFPLVADRGVTLGSSHYLWQGGKIFSARKWRGKISVIQGERMDWQTKGNPISPFRNLLRRGTEMNGLVEEPVLTLAKVFMEVTPAIFWECKTVLSDSKCDRSWAISVSCYFLQHWHTLIHCLIAAQYHYILAHMSTLWEAVKIYGLGGLARFLKSCTLKFCPPPLKVCALKFLALNFCLPSSKAVHWNFAPSISVHSDLCPL